MYSHTGPNPCLHNNKRFVFHTNLNKLLSDVKRFPPSTNPCLKCSQKKRSCICDAINSGVGRTPRYEIAELRETKSMLNDLRDSLNDVDMEKWSTHTKLLDNTSLVTKHLSEIKLNVNGKSEQGVELITNAWLKLYEMLEFYNLVEYLKPNFKTEGGVLTSFHISECPGGFVAALNHNLKSKNYSGHLKWFATSLNPYYEGNDPNVVLAEDILFRETYQNWLLGYDNSGNITRSCNIEFIWDHISRPSRHNKAKTPILVDLVTADGSFNCQFDPNNQERLTSSLKFAEVVCALGLLRVGGCFILKMFNLFEECSLSIFTLLALCFKKIEVYKPFLSKESNSEVYVICLNFNGITSILLSSLCKFVDQYSNEKNTMSIFPREWVPSGFRAEFVDCSKLFAENQWRNLRNALSLYKTTLNENPYYKDKREFANIFIKQFKIGPISPESRLVKRAQFGQFLISGKDTCSLGHLEKKYFPKFQDRKEYHSLYETLQMKRRNNKKNNEVYLCLSPDSEELYSKSVKDVVKYIQKNRPKGSLEREEGALEMKFKLDEDVHESLLDDLKNQRYMKENWFSVGNLESEEFKFSFFCSNDTLFELMYLRSYCFKSIPVTTVQECIMKSSSYGEALTDLNSFPNSTMVHLALIFKNHLNLKNYRYYLEITSNTSQQFPSISLLKRYGIAGSLIYNHAPAKPDGEAKREAEGDEDEQSNLFVFDNLFELHTILSNFPGDGTVELCYEYDYSNLLSTGQSYKTLIGEILESNLKRNCNFIFCDTGDNRSYRELLHKELNAKVTMVAQLIQSLNCLSDNGDMVIRVFTVFSRFTVGILCCLATVFDSVYLCKPESVVSWSQETFVVCKNYKDKDNSICRHFFQFLWEVLSSHKKNNQSLLQIIKPFHFTTIAKKLYEFNNLLLNNELYDLMNKNDVFEDYLSSSKEFINRHKLLDLLYPQKLLENNTDVQLLKLQYNNDVVNTNNMKRKRVETPIESESEPEPDSPIWSSDNEDQ
ncbi:methyltransferase cap2 [Theileria orientalis]|uniref:Cap-specific mRNA (nucleoside-2'-O-)-methyltransferase 2 n=1 Tax=Theileria orientalis TaxID=68886 RepID=A0A976MBC8_THEOR|nr:methyltransferase cap2 [Theileria orientalis]